MRKTVIVARSNDMFALVNALYKLAGVLREHGVEGTEAIGSLEIDGCELRYGPDAAPLEQWAAVMSLDERP